jgi:hypothetical protein
MPIVFGITFGGHDMGESLSKNATSGVVETHLDAAVASSNKELARH